MGQLFQPRTTFWLASLRKKCNLRAETGSWAKYKRRSGEENKNPNNLKVTVLKQFSKDLLPDKFSENRFFLSCIGIVDRYSKSLLIGIDVAILICVSP